MTEPVFISRRVWRIAGKIKRAEEASFYKADRRVIFLLAKDFDEAADLAKDALTTTWSSQPHDAIILQITPVNLRESHDESDQKVYLLASGEPEGAVLEERFMDMAGAVARIQALLQEDDAVTADQAAEIATLATVLEHLVKGDPGHNDDTPADRAVRAIRGLT